MLCSTMAMGRLHFRPGKRSLALGRTHFRPGKRTVVQQEVIKLLRGCNQLSITTEF